MKLKFEKVEKIKIENGDTKIFLDETFTDGMANPIILPNGWKAERNKKGEFETEELKFTEK